MTSKYLVHLEVSLLGALVVVELDEGVLQAVTRLLIAQNFTRANLTKSREDELKIVVGCQRIKLTDEKHVAVGLHLGIGNITQDLEHLRSRHCLKWKDEKTVAE